MKRILASIPTMLLFASLAWPHGNMDHILGTVTKIDGNLLSVENDGKTTDVLLKGSTTYETSGHAGKADEIRIGDRVVIHAVKVQGKEEAHEVRYTHASD